MNQAGLKNITKNYEIVIDRKEGIEKAIRMAKKEDTILIPGFRTWYVPRNKRG